MEPKKKAEWDYSYWRNMLSRAKDEELDALYQKFLAESWTLSPPRVYDKINNRVTPPKLFQKDILVKELILRKKSTGTILVVGSWDACFAFHMGFSGFRVDGIDCCKKAIEVAEVAKSTLPREIASRFNFRYGLAEHLGEYPQYDITTNFCLEHVRDPRQVVEENLKHLKPDGCAYFTPPIGHGTNSPTHLHHFQESDLRGLLPRGFKADIHRTKYLENSPRPNCFVMEAYKG